MVGRPSVDASLPLPSLILLGKRIVALSRNYHLCTLLYVFLSKIQEKRGADSCLLETVILAEGIMQDPLFAKCWSCKNSLLFVG